MTEDQKRQIVEAMLLAKKMKVRPKEGDLTPNQPQRELHEIEVVDSTFEIKYMMACAELGFTDPDVLGHIKQKLLNNVRPTQKWTMSLPRPR